MRLLINGKGKKMKKVSVYGPLLEVDGIMYNFKDCYNDDCQFLLDVVDKFDHSNKHAFYSVKKEIVNYLVRCYELKKAPKVYEVL